MTTNDYDGTSKIQEALAGVVFLIGGMFSLVQSTQAQEVALPQISTNSASGNADKANMIPSPSLKDDVRHSLDTLERVTGRVFTQQDGQNKIDAEAMLRRNPQEATPLLVQAIKDKSKNFLFRVDCLTMLSKKEFAGNVTPAHYQEMMQVVKDDTDDPWLRTQVAGQILRDFKSRPDDMTKEIKKMALSLLGDNKNARTVESLIVRHFPGDKDIEAILLEELRTATNKDSAIYALGKIKSKRAIPELIKLLNSDEAAEMSDESGKTFSKVRAYLALGEIGGEKAFDYLLQSYSDEDNRLDKDIIIEAIGCTKSARAKAFLLDRFQKAGNGSDIVLDAFKYLGDPGVISVLEDRLAREKDSSEERYLQRTIDALQKGDDSTEW